MTRFAITVFMTLQICTIMLEKITVCELEWGYFWTSVVKVVVIALGCSYRSQYMCTLGITKLMVIVIILRNLT